PSSYLHPATPPLYTLSLHDALPILRFERGFGLGRPASQHQYDQAVERRPVPPANLGKYACSGVPFARPFSGFLPLLARHIFPGLDRKSTRLNSSHVKISYAVFCLKK